MGYFASDSEQYKSWQELKDPSNADAFTTEALSFASQYEALRVYEEYVKAQGKIPQKQAQSLVETVVDGWAVLQVTKRATQGGTRVNYKIAQSEARETALGALEDVLAGDA
ncbi:hypothetical protein BC834DRAFT_582533 [Gloeopeniophorella convolvens]|nr:hypothetical protein BC834DRAFT_582533 [Gloeopeniophorella convolvens]